MSSIQSPIVDLSPLDQIRQAEAESARQVTLAKSASDQEVEQARQQAAELVEEARREGLKEGIAKQKTLLGEASEAAEACLAAAQLRAENILSRKMELLETAVDDVLCIVLGEIEDGRL